MTQSGGFVGTVAGLAQQDTHTFSKTPVPAVRLIEGEGVAGDAHCGEKVKHRSRVAVDPTQPNLRQVHLIQAELLQDVGERGFAVAPGDLGENVLTQGIDLLALPCGALLELGNDAVIEVTGLRNPCKQIEDFQSGLLGEVLTRQANGTLVRKAGIMAVVMRGGQVRVGDTIRVVLPELPHHALERV